MINNFYTLKALVREWTPDLAGCVVQDVFSQVRNELTVALQGREQAWMLRTSVQAPFLFIFRTEGISKKRRNVATLFKEAFSRPVEDVRIARRDRMIYLDLEGELYLQFTLFGSRANVFLVGSSGQVLEAFRSNDKHAGEDAPTPRAAPEPASFAAFEKRWRPDRRRTDQAISSAFPIFDRTLSEEAMHRAGVSAKQPEDCTEEERRALFEAARGICKALKEPTPRIYRTDRFAEAFSLIPLHSQSGEKSVETFDTVDAAVRAFVRSRLAQEHFRRLYAPLEEALSRAHEEARRGAERMESELTGESRADRYERWGHLLMAASSDDVPPGADEAVLPDLFGSGEPTSIPLDPTETAIENAERYYDKARRTRQKRKHAEERLAAARASAKEAEDLLSQLREIETLSDLKQFRKDHAERLASYTGEKDEELERFPFRRFPLQGGYEVWVGRNARQNDDLTFHHAQKYDLWMHARGVPGSHTILHLPNRDAEPDKRLLYQAASIAAYYSKARGSSAAPVMIARRKHVRKPSGAPAGAVRVEHEDVVLVEPHLPPIDKK